MRNKVHDVTAEVVLEFTRSLYQGHARRYGGDCTLNELRVMNQIILCRMKGRYCGVTALHKATGIPVPTVSRCVAHLRSKGLLVEAPHPEDGRRRVITLDTRFLKIAKREIGKKADWFNQYRDNGEATSFV